MIYICFENFIFVIFMIPFCTESVSDCSNLYSTADFMILNIFNHRQKAEIRKTGF